jgi:hypothetical protein
MGPLKRFRVAMGPYAEFRINGDRDRPKPCQLATSGWVWLIPGIGGCVGSIDPTPRLVMIVNSVVLKALVGRRMADVGATKDEGHDRQT